MTIDINELRRLAQANYESNSVDSLYALQDAFGYKTVLELLDRLEAAEKERDAAELMSLALRAKVEQMERQEPVFWWRPCSDGTYEGPLHNNSIERVRKLSGAWSPLYALPGAQPASSVPEGWKLVPTEPTGDMVTAAILSSHAINTHRAEHCYRAMIAAAPNERSESPETKP